jgi:predicted secreted protein
MKQVRLHVGEAYIQELRLNAGTGYDWDFKVEGEEHVVEIEKRLAPVKAGAAGGPVLELFTIHGAHKGIVVIHFDLKRNWEGEPAETQSVQVTVLE